MKRQKPITWDTPKEFCLFHSAIFPVTFFYYIILSPKCLEQWNVFPVYMLFMKNNINE